MMLFRATAHFLCFGVNVKIDGSDNDCLSQICNQVFTIMAFKIRFLIKELNARKAIRQKTEIKTHPSFWHRCLDAFTT